MVGAALLARNAVERGLARKPWVKTTLAPGSKVVMDYYERAGPAALPGEARLQPGRLRLHHLHRQLRPAARARSRRRSHADDLAVVAGAVRQPQLRGPDQPGREDELPGLAAAGRRLRAGRHDGHRHAQRAAGHRPDGKPVYLRDIWPSPATVAGGQRRRSPRRCSPATTPTCSRATTAGGRCRRRPGDTLRLGRRVHLRAASPPYFEGMHGRAGAGHRHRAARGCWRSWATRSPPTTSRPAGAIKTD